jgi:hypothetical protein
MKQYIVIQHFKDLQDNGYEYRIGKPFPRKGVTVSQERIDELSGYKNKRRRPLIEALPDDFVDEPVDEPVEKPKRRGRKKRVD